MTTTDPTFCRVPDGDESTGQEVVDLAQPTVSHHLKVLVQAELVATRREGNAIFYRRALPDSLRLGGRLHAALLEEVDVQHATGPSLESVARRFVA